MRRRSEATAGQKILVVFFSENDYQTVAKISPLPKTLTMQTLAAQATTARQMANRSSQTVREKVGLSTLTPTTPAACLPPSPLSFEAGKGRKKRPPSPLSGPRQDVSRLRDARNQPGLSLLLLLPPPPRFKGAPPRAVSGEGGRGAMWWWRGSAGWQARGEKSLSTSSSVPFQRERIT